MPTWPLDRTYITPALHVRGRCFTWGARTYVMGIINATPDSFSGDGIGSSPRRAAGRARRLESAGADIIDIGAQSSRPEAELLAAGEELTRLLPSLKAIRRATALPISVDTYHAVVAEAALEAGADIINDIHGLRFDPAMAAVAARHGVPVIAMHNQRGRPFFDVVDNIRAGFETSLALAAQAGIPRERVILDPGFGFGWTPEQNLEMLRRLPELWDLGLPLLTGVSRKSTLGIVIDAQVDDRFEATAAAVALSIAAGSDIVRVHDVREMVRIARMTDAIVRANWRAPR